MTALTRAAGRFAMAATAVTLLTAAQCPFPRKSKKAAAPAQIAADLPPGADQRMYGARTVLTSNGVAKGVLLSDVALVYLQSNRLELDRVNLTFFDDNGSPDGVMTSRTGTHNGSLQRLEARGDVIINREDGRRLTTPQLVYDMARQQIFSDSAFTLIEPDRQISGIGFETDPRLTTFRCLRACKGIAPVSVPTR